MFLSPSGRNEMKNKLSDRILVGSVGLSVGWLVSRLVS